MNASYIKSVIISSQKSCLSEKIRYNSSLLRQRGVLVLTPNKASCIESPHNNNQDDSHNGTIRIVDSTSNYTTKQRRYKYEMNVSKNHIANRYLRNKRHFSTNNNNNNNNNNNTDRNDDSINKDDMKHNDSKNISKENNNNVSDNNKEDMKDDSFVCDIIKGPSLLRTSMSRKYRPLPTLLSLPGLRTLPYWSQYDPISKQNKIAYQNKEVSEIVHYLESQYENIRNEYTNVMSLPGNALLNDYQLDTEHPPLHEGKWDWNSYMLKGKIQDTFIKNYPMTSSIIQELRNDQCLFEEVPFGYTFFSTLHPNSHIKPHTAPMNLRLRIHLPLIVPSNDDNHNEQVLSNNSSKLKCGIRVGSTTRQWDNGKSLVFDDSYEHEVWNYTVSNRVLLLVDIWHPDICKQERNDIIEMFQHAKEQGWWST